MQAGYADDMEESYGDEDQPPPYQANIRGYGNMMRGDYDSPDGPRQIDGEPGYFDGDMQDDDGLGGMGGYGNYDFNALDDFEQKRLAMNYAANAAMDRMQNLGPPVQFAAVEVMPEEVEESKPFILYLDSLNTVSTINMQCLR